MESKPLNGESMSKAMEALDKGLHTLGLRDLVGDIFIRSMPKGSPRRNFGAGPNSYGDPYIRGANRVEVVDEHIVMCIDDQQRMESIEFIGTSKSYYVDEVWKHNMIDKTWAHHHYGSAGATPSNPHYHCGSQKAPNYRRGLSGPPQEWLARFAGSKTFFVNTHIDEAIPGPTGKFLLNLLSPEGMDKVARGALTGQRNWPVQLKLMRAAMAYLNELPVHDQLGPRGELAKSTAFFGVLLAAMHDTSMHHLDKHSEHLFQDIIEDFLKIYAMYFVAALAISRKATNAKEVDSSTESKVCGSFDAKEEDGTDIMSECSTACGDSDDDSVVSDSD